MGIAALLDRDATITTRLGGEAESVVLRIRNGVVSPADLFAHFPIPMARAWDKHRKATQIRVGGTGGTVFAINHAATALLIRRRYPDVPFIPILLSVQVMEFLWVTLNYLGVERTTTEPVVRYVGDIHLEFMPYSHSVATMLAVAGFSGAAGAAFRRPRLGAAFGIGVLSHLLLDLATHNGDIALAPFAGTEGYGTYLYGNLPTLAFVVELGFGVFCWWVYRGRRALLAVIVGFNLANLSLFFAAVPGLEGMLAGRSQLLVTVILFQIVVTLWALWWTANRRSVGALAG